MMRAIPASSARGWDQLFAALGIGAAVLSLRLKGHMGLLGGWQCPGGAGTALRMLAGALGCLQAADGRQELLLWERL